MYTTLFLINKTIKMKRMIIMAFTALLVTTTTFAQHKKGTMKHHHMAKQQYTCSMHPEVVMDKPGKCPQCGMALIKMKPGKKSMQKKEDMKDMKM